MRCVDIDSNFFHVVFDSVSMNNDCTTDYYTVKLDRFYKLFAEYNCSCLVFSEYILLMDGGQSHL